MLRHGTDDGDEYSERGKHAMYQSERSVWSGQDPRGTKNSLCEPGRCDGHADSGAVASVIRRPLGCSDVAKSGVDDEGDHDRQANEVGVNNQKRCLHDQLGVSSGEERR